ncbi:phage holin family protein [Rhodococcus sp. NPDC127530]|uniref:phage holin family protein n=1 Tax=unclassified Rhodococcus (in: high G+C Gram-positive bacteria) TaxID=192944 RepID=UPI00363E3216
MTDIHRADAPRVQPPSAAHDLDELPTVQLVERLTEQVSGLVRTEMTHALTEVKDKGARFGIGAGVSGADGEQRSRRRRHREGRASMTDPQPQPEDSVDQREPRWRPPSMRCTAKWTCPHARKPKRVTNSRGFVSNPAVP